MAINKNLGETGELLIKAKLLECMKAGAAIKPFNVAITSLHLGDFKSARGFYSTRASCPSLEALSILSRRNYSELKNQLGAIGIVKAGTSMKADVKINGIGYSIKSSSNRPAIINHTYRKGFLRIANQLRITIKPLDDEIEKYWHLRLEQNNVSEDASGYTRRNAGIFISNSFKQYFRPIFNHFAFIGTGRSDSPEPAKYVLEFDDPTDHATWRIIDRDSFYDMVWPELVFSMRDKLSKGQRLSLSTMDEMDKPWAKVSRNKLQAQLHVRAG